MHKLKYELEPGFILQTYILLYLFIFYRLFKFNLLDHNTVVSAQNIFNTSLFELVINYFLTVINFNQCFHNILSTNMFYTIKISSCVNPIDA